MMVGVVFDEHKVRQKGKGWSFDRPAKMNTVVYSGAIEGKRTTISRKSEKGHDFV